MNRRSFTLSLAALGLAPPLPSLAAATPAQPMFTPYMYGVGAHLARSTGICSAEILARKLALSPSAARAMQAQLIRNGVVTASNATGLAVAAEPYMASVRFKSLGGVAAKSARKHWRQLSHVAAELDTDQSAKDTQDQK